MSVTCAITWSYGIWGVRFLNVYQQLLLSGIHDKVHFKGHTIKPGTPKHGTRNTSATPEHWWNTGTLAEQQNTGRKIGISRNSGTCEEQWNKVTTKQHQEILPIQNDVILSR